MIRLLANQIPRFWNIIKHAAVASDSVPQNRITEYTITLLQDLLSDKAQCFVKVSDNKVQLIFITRVVVSKITTKKQLYITGFYAFVSFTRNFTKDDFARLCDYARSRGCDSLIYETPHKSLWAMAEKMGMSEMTRKYRIDLEPK